MTRRIVTGLDEHGRAAVIADGEPPRSTVHSATPGMVNTVVWGTTAPAVRDAREITTEFASMVPAPGETRALMVTFPPDAVYGEPSFDPIAADAEQLAATPGLAELFERDAPGMHTTPTVDYALVVRGHLLLDLDGDTVPLEAGDVVVQNGTRHAWRNPGDEPATAFFVMIGASPEQQPEADAR